MTFGNFVLPKDKSLMLTLCLEQESLLISHGILEALGNPRQIQLLINPTDKKLMLQACKLTDRNALIIPANNEPQFEMSGHYLLKNICKITGWEDTQPRVIYGNHVPGHQAVLFDLTTAQLAQLQDPPQLKK